MCNKHNIFIYLFLKILAEINKIVYFTYIVELLANSIFCESSMSSLSCAITIINTNISNDFEVIIWIPCFAIQ